MHGYKISEAARATGFTESALRFYEQEGVVVPERTAAGYRSYRPGDLDSLRFVARGKKLGLSLEEITELLDLLGEEDCASVQARMRQLVAERIAQAQERIAELIGFTAQLQEAAGRLGLHTPEGACDDTCGCRSDPARSATRHPERAAPLAAVTASDVACSIEPGHVRGRIADWNTLLAEARSREAIPDGARIRFGRNIDIGALGELVAAEQSCCSFLAFTIAIGLDDVGLEVTGPADAQPVIAAVFGTAAKEVTA